MDEFALHDIPQSIEYILDTTSASSLSYIGFSQGTAQAFASLAIHPRLNDKLDLFIALAPAMSPAGLSNGIVDALVKHLHKFSSFFSAVAQFSARRLCGSPYFILLFL